MGEILFELVLQPLGELVGYAFGYMIIPTVTLGWVRAEPLRSRVVSYNWAGVRRRGDGVLVLSHNATAAWGIGLFVATLIACAVVFGSSAAASDCPRQASSFAMISSEIS